MIRACLGISLVACLTLPAMAAAGPENDKTPGPSTVPLRQLLKQVAKSPLEPGDADLLRAVADLIEKEQAAGARATVAVHPAPPMPAPRAAPAEPRKRLVIGLRNAPAVDAAKALEEYLDGQRKVRRANGDMPDSIRAVLVPEPLSNRLLVSGTPEVVDSLTELIAALDAPPDMVMVNVWIAELLPSSRGGKTDDGASPGSATEKVTIVKEDGAAWLERAEKQGHLEVLSRPRVMTLDNQPATIRVGSRVPGGAPRPGADAPAEDDQTEVGVTVGLTPRISPEGLVVMQLDVQRASLLGRDQAARPIIAKTAVRTTISAKEGQMVVLGGLARRAEDGQRQLIIAVTPHVNRQR